MTESIVMQTAVTISAFSLYSFLVFTPEPLVLLRDLIFVASLTGGTLCLYKYWEGSSLKPIVAAFQSGGLSAMRTLFLKMALSRGVEYGSKLRDSVWQGAASFVGLLSSLATPTRWFKTYNPFTPTSQNDPVNAPNPQQFYAVLVTTPPLHRYGVVSDSLCAPIDHCEKIDWNMMTTDAIPPLRASLVFRRHFALCLIPEEVWKSTKTTLENKLTGQSFWDYSGEGSLISKASRWSTTRIRAINAIQELGPTIPDGNIVKTCSSLHRQLSCNWDYVNIWWNSADFALTLAFLLADEEGALACRQIMVQMANCRYTQVCEPRSRAWHTVGGTGVTAFVAAWTATAVTGGALLPITGPLMAAGWGLGFGSGVANAITATAESHLWKRRLKACKEVENRFARAADLYASQAPS